MSFFARFLASNSIISSVLLPIGIIFIVAMLSVGYLWVGNEYQKLEEGNTRFATEYLEEQKALLRGEVMRVRALLRSEKARAEKQMEADLQVRVHTAHQIASRLYEMNKDLLPAATIQQMILESLAALPGSEDEGYYFVTSLDQRLVMYPPNPSYNGQLVSSVMSASEQAVLAGFKQLVETQNEGFSSYRWIRPGHEGRDHQKYSYVKVFEPYGWVIGTGDYLESVEDRMKARLFRQIADMTYGINGEGYFFINSYDGDLYLTNGEYVGGERNIWEAEDERGHKVVQENARLAKASSEGGFSRYTWKKADGTETEKISYVLGMEEWDIFIGTGAYLDTIQREVAERTEVHAEQVRKRIYSALSVLGAALAIVILAVYMIGRRLARNLEVVQSSFIHAVDSRNPIDPRRLDFDEFKQLASSANQMIDGLNAQAAELRHRVFHDHLTALPNRFHGADHLDQMILRARQSNSTVGLLFIDLDNFKEVNDSLGHSAGDELLQQVSRRLQAAVRKEDKVARLGGDEFKVITGLLADRSQAEVIAQHIMEVFEHPYTVEGTELHITCSIGISLFPDDGREAEILLRNADSAMYEAKRDGRNAYRFYTPEMTEEIVTRVQMVDALRDAIEYKQFELHYQPQIGLADGEIIGVEALVRWRHPERGLVPPGEFIPYAEASGQIAQIGEWVLREACARMVAWRADGRWINKIAVNISNQQLRRTPLSEQVRVALDRAGCPASALEIEITESTLMKDPETMRAELGHLQTLGVSMAVDDFGTGYSSLSYLKQLPINTLKIDRSFIRDIDVDPNDRAITRAVIGMGRSLNLTVIAEGVEKASQVEFLAREGCQQVQGFYYARPMPEEELLAFVDGFRPGEKPA